MVHRQTATFANVLLRNSGRRRDVVRVAPSTDLDAGQNRLTTIEKQATCNRDAICELRDQSRDTSSGSAPWAARRRNRAPAPTKQAAALILVAMAGSAIAVGFLGNSPKKFRTPRKHEKRSVRPRAQHPHATPVAPRCRRSSTTKTKRGKRLRQRDGLVHRPRRQEMGSDGVVIHTRALAPGYVTASWTASTSTRSSPNRSPRCRVCHPVASP